MTDRRTHEESDLRREVDALQRAIVDIRGESGSNGKLGELKRRVDTAEARRWWLVTFAVGLVATAITAAVALGAWMGSLETDVEALKRRQNSFQPASAGKDSP